MSLIVLLIVVILIWAVLQNMVFMPAPVGTIVNILFLILVVLLVLELVGVNTGIRLG
jgi:hypothetical protein